MFPLASLVGQSVEHLAEPADDTPVQRDVVPAFVALREAARDAGFDLRILSGFRSFDRQLSIWNRKARGELPVLDSAARPLDIATLSGRDLAFAILRWSALPGASRHHWGTDLDVYDEAARPAGYTVDLVPAEVEQGGMFAPLHEWLDEHIANGTSFGFFRPYDRDRHGVAPERWHVSFAPVAAECMAGLTPDLLRRAIEPSDMMLKGVVLQHLEAIYSRFVTNTNPVMP
jgi:LAS superfamily LD-carboxypeptidase LdcB